MMFLLDTNAWIVHLRTKGTSRLSQRLRSTPPSDLATCPIVRMELMVGAHRGPNPAADVRIIEALLPPIRSFDLHATIGDAAAMVRSTLERQGLPIGGYDYLIAATALIHEVTVVTHNLREFSGVPSLLIEDWQ